ncbi:MAG: DUF1254 domain-containing protein [Nitrospirota bacterium]|nr:MAG: DUF1254 domain-containing protein [Nitrospirota bacterium]
MDATYRDGGSPNNDTMYSITWAYVKEEPLIISVPNVGTIPGTDEPRYFNFQLSGFDSDNFAYIGTRTTGNQGGHYAITPPRWQGRLPENVERLTDAPTPWIFIVGRTMVTGPEDIPVVRQIQARYKLTTLGEWGKEHSKRPFSPEIRAVADLREEPRKAIDSYWSVVNEALSENPPDEIDGPIITLFQDIEVGPGRDVSRLSPAMGDGMQRAAMRGLQILRAANESNYGAKLVNGWTYLPHSMGRAGKEGDFLLRAAVQSLGGIVANDPEEAVYLVVMVDGNGDRLNGKNRYRLRFAKENLPVAKAFWSVTMYDMTRNLTSNDLDRYSLGDRSRGLKYDQDGGLTLYFSHRSPAKENMGNWLPAPDDQFYCILRAYLPSQAIVDQTWEPSPLQKY